MYTVNLTFRQKKQGLYFLVVVCSLLLAAAQNSLAQKVSYVPNSTVKIEQLIGDTDKQRKTSTNNLTYTRYNLNATDLGVPFMHKGKTFVLFGDVWPTDRDPIAYSTDENPDDGLSLDFLTDNSGTWAPIDIPGISQGSFEVPVEGVSWNNIMYVYAATDYNSSEGFSTKSILARSTDDGKTFTKLYDVSSSKFINISVVKFKTCPNFPIIGERRLQCMFGSGKYRQSDVYFAYQFASDIETNKIKYFSGMKNGRPQFSNNEDSAIALFDQPCVGELSVSYNKFIKKWIMLYNCDNPRGINCRTAKYPWGPWSKPIVIFDPWSDNGYCNFIHTDWNFTVCDSVHDSGREYVWGGEYGPYQFEDFATGNDTETTIYYTLSTWNPYTVVLMKSTLKLETPAILFSKTKGKKEDYQGLAKK